jgi:hypothetical protein
MKNRGALVTAKIQPLRIVLRLWAWSHFMLDQPLHGLRLSQSASQLDTGQQGVLVFLG